MKIRLTEMLVAFKQSRELIEFGNFTYFHGKIGAGKSTIARLIDYCFGGDLQITPAMQSEFVDVTLSLVINSVGVFYIVKEELTKSRRNGQKTVNRMKRWCQ